MGRIEEVLRQAKERRDERAANSKFSSSANGGASDRVARLDRRGTKKVFEELNKAAKFLMLDSDVLQENRITTDDQLLHVRAAYKMLRTRILSRLRSNRWNSIAVSSARSNAGKTLTAINTAMSIAHELNKHVILVDLDLRRPSIAQYLGIEPEYDLVDHLISETPIEDVVIKTSIDRLLIIPTTHTQENSSELLSGPTMQDLAAELANDSEGAIVVYDLPPMLEADDMLAFARNVDCLLFVVAECETRAADLKLVENLIEEVNVLGVVLNKSNDTAPAYY